MLAICSPSDPLAEGAKRSAVSRAYYAAFCSVRNYAAQHLNYSIQHSSQDHRQLLNHLRRIGTAPWDDVENKLRDLRQYRNRCDYEDSVSNLDNIVEASLRLASEILNVL